MASDDEFDDPLDAILAIPAAPARNSSTATRGAAVRVARACKRARGSQRRESAKSQEEDSNHLLLNSFFTFAFSFHFRLFSRVSQVSKFEPLSLQPPLPNSDPGPGWCLPIAHVGQRCRRVGPWRILPKAKDIFIIYKILKL